MAKEYLQVDGKLILVNGKLVEVPSETESSNAVDTQGISLAATQEISEDIYNSLVGYVNGSPKGVYSSISELQNAYPNGTNGIFLTTDNGKWNYWSGTSWTAGGDYLTNPMTTTNGTVISSNADFAEVGKSITQPIENGYFITAVGYDETLGIPLIRKATSTSDIRGVSVNAPAFCGGLKREFLSGSELRQGLSYVGFAGIVNVIDNGKCTINGSLVSRCMSDDDGTAKPSNNNMGYQIISRVNANIIKIVVEPSADMIQRIKADIAELERNVGTLQENVSTLDNANLVMQNTAKGSGTDKIVQLHPENNPQDNLYPTLTEEYKNILLGKKNVIVYDFDNFYAENKYYSGVTADNTIVSTPTPTHKSIKVDIFDDKAFLKFEMLTDEHVNIPLGFLEKKDGTFLGFNINSKDTFISLLEVKTIYLNLFLGSSRSPMLKYEMIFIEDSPLENLNDVYEITNTTYGIKNGFINRASVINSSVPHKYFELEIENFELELFLTEGALRDNVVEVFGVVEFINGETMPLVQSFENGKFYNVKRVVLNFFRGIVKSYAIKKILIPSEKISLGDIVETKVFSKQNLELKNGYYSGCDVLSPASHKACSMDITDKMKKIKYTINEVPAVPIGFIKTDNYCISLPKKLGTNEANISGATTLYFNFFTGNYPDEFEIEFGFDSDKDENIVLNHCVDKPFNFNGKKICFFGDSITEGFTSGTTKTENNYPKLFSNKVGATFDNKGIAGSTLSQVDGYINMSRVIKTTDLAPYYAIFIALGVNDWSLGVTEEKFRNEIESLCEFLKTYYRGEVIFIAPINYIDNGRHGINSVTNIDVFRKVIYEYTTKYDFSFVNGGNFNFLSEDTPYANSLFGDGLHPTELGYKLYAKSLVDVLL